MVGFLFGRVGVEVEEGRIEGRNEGSWNGGEFRWGGRGGQWESRSCSGSCGQWSGRMEVREVAVVYVEFRPGFRGINRFNVVGRSVVGAVVSCCDAHHGVLKVVVDDVTNAEDRRGRQGWGGR